jgi:hypothetical protein
MARGIEWLMVYGRSFAPATATSINPNWLYFLELDSKPTEKKTDFWVP